MKKNTEKNNKKIFSENNNIPVENAASVEIKRKRGRPRKTENNNNLELKNKKNNKINKKNNSDSFQANKINGFDNSEKIKNNNKKINNNSENTENNTVISDPGNGQILKHRGRPKGSTGTIRKDRRENTLSGDNTKFLSHDLKLFHLPSVDMNDLQAVNDRIDFYFNLCTIDDIKPSIASLALAFKVSRFVLYDYINGRNNIIKNTDCLHALKTAYDFINSLYEHYMNNGKINPVAGIFLMKNNMGYKDTTDHVITANTNDNVTDNDIYNRAALYD